MPAELHRRPRYVEPRLAFTVAAQCARGQARVFAGGGTRMDCSSNRQCPCGYARSVPRAHSAVDRSAVCLVRGDTVIVEDVGPLFVPSAESVWSAQRTGDSAAGAGRARVALGYRRAIYTGQCRRPLAAIDGLPTSLFPGCRDRSARFSAR